MRSAGSRPIFGGDSRLCQDGAFRSRLREPIPPAVRVPLPKDCGRRTAGGVGWRPTPAQGRFAHEILAAFKVAELDAEAQGIPHRLPCMKGTPRCPEHRAAEHQPVLPVPVAVLQIVERFQVVEGLVFELPAGASGPHGLHRPARPELDVGGPAERPLPRRRGPHLLPGLADLALRDTLAANQNVGPEVPVAVVRLSAVVPVEDVLGYVRCREFAGLAVDIQLLLQDLVVASLGAHDEGRVQLAEKPRPLRLGARPVHQGADFEMRMLPPDVRK